MTLNSDLIFLFQHLSAPAHYRKIFYDSYLINLAVIDSIIGYLYSGVF